jgi:hypothetical protein
MHESFLRYRHFRWLRIAVLVVAADVVLAGAPSVYRRREVVYGLGIVSALLMVWLAAYAVRKRRYSTTARPLRGWLSAHAYLGVLPLVLVPVHAAFRFGPNVHTLAFVLTAVVVLSGMLGAVLYAALPTELTRNRPEGKLEDLLVEIGKVDAECLALRADVSPEVARLVDAALGDDARRGLRALRRGRAGATVRALAALRDETRGDRQATNRLLTLLAWRARVIRQVRRELRLQAWLDGWLTVHAPLAFAALAAVAVHVLVILRYR